MFNFKGMGFNKFIGKGSGESFREKEKFGERISMGESRVWRRHRWYRRVRSRGYQRQSLMRSQGKETRWSWRGSMSQRSKGRRA